ncbi:hypothetical protein LUZ60_007572 [Juncus effusus]|nr:hypothetical protein LUZ60_007572 [Juncus effusus]
MQPEILLAIQRIFFSSISKTSKSSSPLSTQNSSCPQPVCSSSIAKMWGKGLRSKTKKFMQSTVHVNYLINIQEIHPWPPSQSLKSIRSVVLQWENGLRSSGFTHPSSPLDSKIEFNESFMLQVSFSKDTTGVDITTAIGTGVGTFETNLLEFSLYEPKKENPKGKLIGSGLIDLADYGVLKEAVELTVPIGGAKKSWKGGSAPVLCVRIQPLDRDRDGSAGAGTAEYETESEVEMAGFTDDEFEREPSSHSSSLASSFHQETTKEINGGSDYETDPTNGSLSNQETLKTLKDEINNPTTDKEIYEITPRTPNTPNTLKLKGLFKDAIKNERNQKPRNEILVISNPVISNPEPQIQSQSQIPSPESQSQSQTSQRTPAVLPPRFSQTNRKMSFAGLGTGASTGTGTGTNPRRFFGDRTYSTLTTDMARTLKLPPINPNPSSSDEVKDVHMQQPSNPNPNPNPDDDDERITLTNPIRITSNASRNIEKIKELESRVELLEGELRDAAAVEIGLYSIVPEHASSAHKVHTPARRLARLYVFAVKNWSKEKRAKAARSISSALVLVARSCGNDVQRLVYWLSNTVVLRTIIKQTTKQSDQSSSTEPLNGSGSGSKKKTAALWESVYKKRGKLLFTEELEHWANPGTLVSALEKTESWIFSRILESVWWQIFTPHMQSAKKANETQKNLNNNKRIYGKVTIIGDQKQANLSIEIWKKAFKDASEKLCPIRACGHECGCLPIIARLVMEQCVARLDVAMFNAILRESGEEVPTDPLWDPITDPKILPVPHGKSSFGAGVQLKNAIGSWSRFLTDLFGIDMDESKQDSNGKGEISPSFVPFHLLNALSDLLMLPKDMLLETSVRKEVCPTFSSSIIKRVLDGFITDEFCPVPISEDVLNALQSKDHLEPNEPSIRQIPCNLSPFIYSPPSIALIESIIGDIQTSQSSRGGSSSIIRKSYYSDDELEELNSPLTSVIEGASNRLNGVKKNYRTHAVRYQLLHEIWKDDE